MRRELGFLLVVVALGGVTGCVPPGFPSQSGNTTPVSSVSSSPASTAITAESAPVDSVAPPTVATPPPPLAPSSTTVPTPVGSEAIVTQFEAPSDARTGVIDSVADVATSDDGTAAYMVGRLQPAPGDPAQAMVWVTDGRTRARTTPLEQPDADESWANGVATRGNQILVAGTIRTGERTAGVIWRSDDAGLTFGPPELVDDAVTALIDVGFGEQGLVAVGTTQAPGQRPTPVFLRGSGDGWTSAVLPGPDQRSVESLTVNGAVMIATGSSAVAGEVSAMMWQSADRGASFVPIEPVGDYFEVGTVNVHDGTYITSARGKNDDPMMILTSTDGSAWTATEVKLSLGGERYVSQYKGGERVVVASDGTYVTEVGSGFGYVGRIASDGRGEAINVQSGRLQANFTLIPFEVGGQISVVSNTERSFSILSESDSGWDYTGKVAASGALASFTTLHEVGGQIAVRATTYPVVSKDGQQFSSVDFWTMYDESLQNLRPLTAVALPVDASLWAGNDQIELAISVDTDDPADDEYAGSFGGTAARTRLLPNGTWSEPELILSGPGGDHIQAIDRLGPGFVAVGGRSESGADQISTTTPVILEYLEGKWTTARLPDLSGTSIGLYGVVGTSGGNALAIGYSNDPALVGPLVLSRGTDGAWTQVDLPVRDAGASVMSTSFTDGRFELLIDDAGTFAVLTSDDGNDFQRSDLRFDDPFLAEPVATARTDGKTYVVGLAGHVDARSLALWELLDDGSLQAVDLSGDVPVGNVDVDSVVVNGADIWASGETADLAVAWKINFGSDTAATTTAPPGAVPNEPATTSPVADV